MSPTCPTTIALQSVPAVAADLPSSNGLTDDGIDRRSHSLRNP
jgi:hypothetical protein